LPAGRQVSLTCTSLLYSATISRKDITCRQGLAKTQIVLAAYVLTFAPLRETSFS